MIRNILFDMGSVLVDFNPLRFTMEAKLSPEDAQLVREELFRSIEWAQLDRGTLTDRALLEIMKPRFPERLWPTLEWMICRWDEPPVMVEGMYELVQELSEAGYGLYLLSNAALRHDEYWPRYPVSRFFGDGVPVHRRRARERRGGCLLRHRRHRLPGRPAPSPGAPGPGRPAVGRKQ